MPSFRKPLSGLTCLFALATAGCSAGSDSTTSYAPYVSATDASGNDSSGSPSTYNLAFVIASGSSCTPSWDGEKALSDSAVKSRISQLKQDDATVRVSFGGASGKELAATCGSVTKLAAAYGRALDAVGSRQADFDIEGDELTDSGSVAMRSAAIALLQKQRSDLEVTFTLPVMPSGLDSDGLALLESANKYDVQVGTVNLMTMNYGESYTGDMGDYALTSAKAAHDQLEKVFGLSEVGAWQGMALTSMIGVNDVEGETFSLSDAGQVRAFAEEKGVAWVSMWSTFRDEQCVDDDSAGDDASTDCSGVKQSPGAFGKAFAG